MNNDPFLLLPSPTAERTDPDAVAVAVVPNGTCEVCGTVTGPMVIEDEGCALCLPCVFSQGAVLMRISVPASHEDYYEVASELDPADPYAMTLADLDPVAVARARRYAVAAELPWPPLPYNDCGTVTR